MEEGTARRTLRIHAHGYDYAREQYSIHLDAEKGNAMETKENYVLTVPFKSHVNPPGVAEGLFAMVYHDSHNTAE